MRRSPACRTRAKSRLCASRRVRPKRRRFGAGVTKSNGRQAFAARATAASDGGLAAFGLVAGTETMLAFAADF